MYHKCKSYVQLLKYKYVYLSINTHIIIYITNDIQIRILKIVEKLINMYVYLSISTHIFVSIQVRKINFNLVTSK